jgi:hypothetical protein
MTPLAMVVRPIARRSKRAAVTRGNAMNDRLNPKIGRRDVLRVLAAGAATSACASADADNAANKGGFPDKRKARYQADSPEVQTFYRVNRYPQK